MIYRLYIPAINSWIYRSSRSGWYLFYSDCRVTRWVRGLVTVSLTAGVLSKVLKHHWVIHQLCVLSGANAALWSLHWRQKNLKFSCCESVQLHQNKSGFLFVDWREPRWSLLRRGASDWESLARTAWLIGKLCGLSQSFEHVQWNVDYLHSTGSWTCVFLCLFQAADSPHMLTVPMTWVKAGGMVRLDKKYLQTDFRGVSSDDIVYSINATEGQPKYGTRLHQLFNFMLGCKKNSDWCQWCLVLRWRSLFDKSSSLSRWGGAGFYASRQPPRRLAPLADPPPRLHFHRFLHSAGRGRRDRLVSPLWQRTLQRLLPVPGQFRGQRHRLRPKPFQVPFSGVFYTFSCSSFQMLASNLLQKP